MGVQLERINIDTNFETGSLDIAVPDYLAVHDLGKMDTNVDLQIGKVKSSGIDNLIAVGPGCTIRGLRISVRGSRNRVIIGSNCKISGDIKISGSHRTILVGAKTTIGGGTILIKDVGDIYIGRECMFSTEIDIRTSDSHPIYDLDTMERVNPSSSVFIGDHVWIGKGAIVAKGTTIADDNIVGMRAFVSGEFFASTTTIVGAPAKVVRTGRSWSRRDISDMSKSDLCRWRQTPLL